MRFALRRIRAPLIFQRRLSSVCFVARLIARFVVCFVVCSAACFASFAACRAAYETAEGPIDRFDLPLKITKLSKHLFLIEDFNYWKSNYVFYAHPRGIVFLDAGWTPSSARRLIWKALIKSEAEFMAVVPTGFQIHRTGGLPAFQKRNIRIYLQEKTARILELYWDAMQRNMKRDFGSWRVFPGIIPDGIFKKKLKLLGGKIHILYPGDAHSPGNVVAYFPEEKILYAGSLLSDPLFFTGKINCRAFSHALAQLKQFPFTRIISGHGKPIRGPNLTRFVLSRTCP